MTRWHVLAVSSSILAIFTLSVGFYQFFYTGLVGAEWLTASGGFALISFAAVQLHLENKRENARQEAARAKLKTRCSPIPPSM